MGKAQKIIAGIGLAIFIVGVLGLVLIQCARMM